MLSIDSTVIFISNILILYFLTLMINISSPTYLGFVKLSIPKKPCGYAPFPSIGSVWLRNFFLVGPKQQDFWPKINIPTQKKPFHQKLYMMLENELFWKLNKSDPYLIKKFDPNSWPIISFQKIWNIGMILDLKTHHHWRNFTTELTLLCKEQNRDPDEITMRSR